MPFRHGNPPRHHAAPGWFFFPLLTLEGLNLHAHGIRHLLSRQPVKKRGWSWRSSRRASPCRRPPSSSCCRSAWPSRSSACSSPCSASTWVRRSRRTTRECRSSTRTPARLLHQAGPHVSQHHGRLVATWMFRRAQPPGRAPPLPEHGAPAPLARTRRRPRLLQSAGIPYTETSVWRSYAVVIDYLNRVGLAHATRSTARWSPATAAPDAPAVPAAVASGVALHDAHEPRDDRDQQDHQSDPQQELRRFDEDAEEDQTMPTMKG